MRELPRFVDARFATLQIATAEVQKPEPHQHARQQGALAERARVVDRLFCYGDGVVPVAHYCRILEFDFRCPRAEIRLTQVVRDPARLGEVATSIFGAPGQTAEHRERPVCRPRSAALSGFLCERDRLAPVLARDVRRTGPLVE